MNIWDGLSETETKLVYTLILVVFLWGFKQLVVNSVSKLSTEVHTRYRWRKNTTYLMYGVGLVSIIFIWSNGFASFATFLGLVSAGLAIAFRDPIVNIAAWYYILAAKIYKVGDRIQVGEHIGDIIDISLFQTTMIEIGNWVQADQSTGRLIYLPNSRVFNTPVVNYSALVNHIWHEIRIPLTLQSDWQLAKKEAQAILEECAPQLSEEVYTQLEELSGKYLISAAKLAPLVFTSIEENTILLTMRFMCPVRKRRAAAETLYEAILQRIVPLEGVHFATNTFRIQQEQ